MTQLELFAWAPPGSVVVAFPHSKRAAVLRDIAEVFVARGYDAGNEKMRIHGWLMIGDLLRLGLSQEQISIEIDKFTAAAREVAARRIIETGMCGGKPATRKARQEMA